MKRHLLYASLLTAGVLCASQGMAQDQVVTLTTAKANGEKVTLRVNQLKKGVTVDWGDGNPVSYAATDDDLLVIEGTTKGTVITLKADKKLNTLVCDGNELTALDVSQAPNLISLYCQNNQLTTLNVSALSALTDLNCANNNLQKLQIVDSANPAIENLNVAGNELATNQAASTSTTFYYKGSALQHLNVAGNKFKALNLTANRALDMLVCNDNGLKNRLNLTMTDSITTVVAHSNEFSAMSMPSSGGKKLRKLVINDNQIPTLSLESCLQLHTLMCKNNGLTSVGLPAKTKLDVMECGGNKLSFSSLPSSKSMPTHITYTPQEEILDITQWLQHDDTGYYMDVCTNWNDRLKDPYVLKIHDLMLDPDGGKTIKAQWMKIDENGQPAEMTKASTAAKTNDYLPLTSTTSYGNVTFLNPYGKVYALFTSTVYPELTFKTTVFRTGKDTPVGIGQVTTGENGLTVTVANKQLTLSAGTDTQVCVYATSGRAVWQGKVAAGETVQLNLPAGVYVVNGKKVVL